MRTRPLLPMASTASGGMFLLAIAWLATRRLSSVEQGYFFSFLSFGALVQLADFGLSYAALQTGGRLAGTNRLGELPAVAGRVVRWNLAASSVAIAVTALIGWGVFSSGTGSAPVVPPRWVGPWMAYLLSVFLSQLTVPGISLREGGGMVAQMWGLRLVQEWVGGAACIGVLQAGGGLWSLSAHALARAVVAALGLRLVYPLRTDGGGAVRSLKWWMSEVWPFQWRIGLSGLSGFLIFRAFAPLVFVEKGPELAGQFGLAISLMNLLIAVTSAWPMSQTARYASGLAAGRFQELRREFPTLIWSSTALSAAAAASLAALLWWARGAGFGFALRLTDPETTSIILAAAVVHHMVASIAMFLRAEGREPLLAASVLGGLITALAVWLAARFGIPRDIAAANLGCAVAGLLVALLLLRIRQRSWRMSPSEGGGSGAGRE